MLPVKHNPLFDVEKISEHYSKKDGVPVKYICTTELSVSDVPMDVFYRATPHPEFGNRYFGLYYRNGSLMITNADKVENLDFGVVEVDGFYHYSQYHHHYNAVNEQVAIDGGRQYVRVATSSVDDFTILKVKNGEFVK